MSSLTFGYAAMNSPSFHSSGGGVRGDLAYISFSRGEKQYINFGRRAYNFSSTGGFTVIVHMAFTGPAKGRQESIFNFDFLSLNASLGRIRSSDYFGATLYSGGVVITEAPDVKNTIAQDQWGYYGAMYSAAEKRLYLFDTNMTILEDVTDDQASIATDVFFGKSPSPTGVF